ncbi:A24 family peptidase [Salinicola endophyticus]|uniref:A24 family peptidase n=1 Tax=Salinicola endophyticus TaxID=1949083 RepID=A0AB74UDY9_9GAMM
MVGEMTIWLYACALLLGLQGGAAASRLADWLAGALERRWVREACDVLGTDPAAELSHLKPVARDRGSLGMAAGLFTAAMLLALLAPLGRSISAFWPGFAVLGWTSLVIVLIDCRYRLIPYALSGLVGLMGLMLHSTVASWVPLAHSVWGGLLGLSLWAVGQLRRDHIGEGDTALLAAWGCWVGVWGVAIVVWGAMVAGLLQLLWLRWVKRHGIREGIPFAPAITVAGWAVLAGQLTHGLPT